MEGGQFKNGCSIALDVFSDVIFESRKVIKGMTVAVCGRDKLGIAAGFHCRKAKKSELYRCIASKKHVYALTVAWIGGK